MFWKPKNINVDIPIKPCNTSHLFNPTNLASVHHRVLLIQPEWLNGLNGSFKKSIGINKNICCNFGLNSFDLNGFQFGFNYSVKNETDSLRKWPTIHFGLNSYQNLAQFFIRYQPTSSFRLTLKNQAVIPNNFDKQFGNDKLPTSIPSNGVLEAIWFGKSSRISFSAISSSEQLIATKLSFLTKATPNIQCGAELHCNQSTKRKPFSLQPCLSGAYLSQNAKFAATFWPNTSKIDLSYFKRISERFQSGSIFVIDAPVQMATATVCCQYKNDDSVIRAKITSNGLVGATCETKLWNISITNSILTNIFTAKTIYGMQIGKEF